MTCGSPWSEAFVRQLSDKEFRDAFVADQTRVRIAQLCRSLREHECWTQTELGRRADKKQNVISRLENPDEAQPSVQTLLEIAAAFDLPVWIDFPQWNDWLRLIRDVPSKDDDRRRFDADHLVGLAELEWPKAAEFANIVDLNVVRQWKMVSASASSAFDAIANGMQISIAPSGSGAKSFDAQGASSDNENPAYQLT